MPWQCDRACDICQVLSLAGHPASLPLTGGGEHVSLVLRSGDRKGGIVLVGGLEAGEKVFVVSDGKVFRFLPAPSSSAFGVTL